MYYALCTVQPNSKLLHLCTIVQAVSSVMCEGPWTYVPLCLTCSHMGTHPLVRTQSKPKKRWSYLPLSGSAAHGCHLGGPSQGQSLPQKFSSTWSGANQRCKPAHGAERRVLRDYCHHQPCGLGCDGGSRYSGVWRGKLPLTFTSLSTHCTNYCSSRSSFPWHQWVVPGMTSVHLHSHS